MPLSFEISSGRYLFVDMFIKKSQLILISTYYVDLRFDFNDVRVQCINSDGSIISIPMYSQLGYKEDEHSRIVTYSLLSEWDPKNKICVEYNGMRRHYNVPVITSTQQHKFCIATLFKDDYTWIPIFYNYYKSQGVDYFYLYYNGDIDTIKDKLFQRDDIQYESWNYEYWINYPPNTPIIEHSIIAGDKTGIVFYKNQHNMNVVSTKTTSHHAQTTFLSLFQMKYLEFNDYTFIGDIDEFIYIKAMTVWEHISQNCYPAYMIVNHWARLPFTLNQKAVVNDVLKIEVTSDPNKWAERSKCIFHKSFAGFLGIHYPRNSKFHGGEVLKMFHLTDVSHAERRVLVTNPITYNLYVGSTPTNKTTLYAHFTQEKSVSVQVNAGLGNRLFQIASAYGLSKKFGRKLIINSTHISHNIHESSNVIDTYIMRYISKQSVKTNCIWNEPNKHLTYNNITLPDKFEHIHLNGYLQSEKYFEEFRKELVTWFVPEMSTSLQNFITKYTPETKAFLHVRRGDYIGHGLYVDLSKTGYYEKALQLYSVPILIFSDDPDWCTRQSCFSNKDKFQIVDTCGLNSLETIYLMSLCHYGGITANSSFSWWGLWLNSNVNKKGVMPREWFTDKSYTLEGIYPKGIIII
jgi:hypothetical protein